MPPVSANSGEYKSVVGVRDVYIALVTQDDLAGYAADTPQYFAPVTEITGTPAVNSKTQYADDGPFDSSSAEGQTELEIGVTSVPNEMRALVTGKVFDTVSGRIFDNGGNAPEVALMFRSKKSNGKYRFYCYLKGKFQAPGEEATTQTDTPEPKEQKLKFTAIKTIYQFDLGSINDGVKKVEGDEDTLNFSGATWFNQVQTPVVVAAVPPWHSLPVFQWMMQPESARRPT